jgi:hypothetical protein
MINSRLVLRLVLQKEKLVGRAMPIQVVPGASGSTTKRKVTDGRITRQFLTDGSVTLIRRRHQCLLQPLEQLLVRGIVAEPLLATPDQGLVLGHARVIDVVLPT